MELFGRFGDQMQSWHATVVARVVGNQRGFVQGCRRCDPGVCRVNAASSFSSGYHDFGPPKHQIARRRYDHKSPQEDSQPFHSLRLPIGEQGPLLEFRFCHERNQPRSVAEVGQVVVCLAVVLEKERSHIRVDGDGLHAAGSVFLWPRHSCRVLKISAVAEPKRTALDSATGTPFMGTSVE